MDHVDKVLEQWRAERPDLDVTAMGVVGRLSRVSLAFSREREKTFALFGLNGAGFDVLATLRRSGAPYCLSPGALLASTMVTSGTMTNRLDRLQDAGLIERRQNPDDSRGFLVSLTPQGIELIDKAVEAHVATQARLIEVLSSNDQEILNALLSRLLEGRDSNPL